MTCAATFKGGKATVTARLNLRGCINFLVYNHDEIHSRLLDLVDPARHNHPGIPYDFFSGYIIMISDQLDEPESQVYSKF
jgi:hypothetical protein